MSSKVVLSFANNNGGTVFVHTFRNKLMRLMNFFDPNDIYLDNVACRDVANSVYHGPDYRKNNAGRSIGACQGGGSYAIGVTNVSWKKMWENAMRTAKVVIIILTKDYCDSVNCQEEKDTICTMLADNRWSDLHLIVIDVGSEWIPNDISPAGNPKSTMIYLPKVSLSEEMQKTFPLSFDIPDWGYKLVVQALYAAGVK
jgi:hypothetical protein